VDLRRLRSAKRLAEFGAWALSRFDEFVDSEATTMIAGRLH
jgi:hypothetical protein